MNLFVHLVSAICFFYFAYYIILIQREKKILRQILKASILNEDSSFIVAWPGKYLEVMTREFGIHYEPSVDHEAPSKIYLSDLYRLLATLKPRLVRYTDDPSNKGFRILEVHSGSGAREPNVEKDIFGKNVKVIIVSNNS